MNKVTHLCSMSRSVKNPSATFQFYVPKSKEVTDLCLAKKKISDLWYICEIVTDLYENYVNTVFGVENG